MQNSQAKPRTVITTDGEVDDMNSVIRFLLYSNEMELAGIVLTSSMYHYAGDVKKGIEPFRWTGTDWLFELIDLYEKVYPNLCIHASGYPTPEHLRDISKIGNVSYVGEMEKETEGSRFLTELFMDGDPRTLYVQTWGGTNTTAKALKSIEEKYKGTDKWESVQQKIYQKLVIYIILDQDDSYSHYIAKAWPKLKIINDRFNFWHFAYAWKMHSPQVNRLINAEWFKRNIKFNHGPLLERYALIGDGQYLDGELYEEQRGIDNYLEKHPEYVRYDFISEGDSPSFFYLIDYGLRSLEDPSYGGWGGRFIQSSNQLYLNDALDYNPYTKQYEAEYSLERWFDDIQNDFAARANWCVADTYEKANHSPSIQIKEGLDLDVFPGQTLTLHAIGSDPDGDLIHFNWWHYFEADKMIEPLQGEVQTIEMQGLVFSKTQKATPPIRATLENAKTDTLTIHLSKNLKVGETVHIIAEAYDEGTPVMKRYQRVILHIK